MFSRENNSYAKNTKPAAKAAGLPLAQEDDYCTQSASSMTGIALVVQIFMT